MKNNSIKLIGLTGRMQSGKDTVAQIIKTELAPDLRVERLGFADALKNDICKLVGKDRKFLDEHKDNFRLMMQGYGTNVGRELFGENYWVLRLGETLRKLISGDFPPDVILVADVRFPNEADFLRELGGHVWRVNRGNINNSTHASEQEYENIWPDAVINNTNSIPNLEHEIKLAWMKTFGVTFGKR